MEPDEHKHDLVVDVEQHLPFPIWTKDIWGPGKDSKKLKGLEKTYSHLVEKPTNGLLIWIHLEFIIFVTIGDAHALQNLEVHEGVIIPSINSGIKHGILDSP